MTTPDPNTLLPLTPAVFHILLALAGGERHGYGIMQEVAALTDGTLRLGPGTLYGTLNRLLADQMIVETTDDETRDDNERRRYYQLTIEGERVARLELHRLRNLVRRFRGIPDLGGATT